MKAKILLVDDEQEILNSTSLLLKSAGYEVETANNGYAAFEILRFDKDANSLPNLMLLDIKMPVLNGLELMRELEKIRLKVPFIAITGFADKQMVIELLRFGCFDFIEKPILPDELLERIVVALGAAASRREQVEKSAAPTLLKLANHEGWQIITPRGDIDWDTAENLRSVLVDMLERGCTQFRLDLQNVTDIDVYGLRILHFFGKMITGMDGRSTLLVSNATHDVKVMFEKTGIDSYYAVCA